MALRGLCGNAAARGGNSGARIRVGPHDTGKDTLMKGALAWLIGIPIPIIILLYVFDVF